MERDSNNENFERFLRQNANNLRMHASEKIWKNISSELSKRRRRIGYGLGIFLLITSTLGYFFITNSIKPIPVVAALDEINSNNTISTSQTSSNTTPVIDILKAPGLQKKASIEKKKSLKSLVKKVPVAQQSITPVSNEETSTDVATQKEEDFTPNYDNTELSKNIEATASTEITPTNTALPLSVESVLNSYKPNPPKKLTWQMSFAPTVSYRKLGENKSYLRDMSMMNAPAGLAPLFNINDVVTHKPDFGLELGVTSKYAVTKNIKILAGLQFNLTRYDIKAFKTVTSVATIRFNSSNGPDSLKTYSSYSNTNGYKSSWLQNFYFQLSAPVGIEVNLGGNNKTKFGISTTIQPTYLLGDRAYAITTDYQNYAEVPWLTRKWNVNTNFQTFIAYSTGKMNWQVGPQVRYQLLSSFVSKYPVKENLFDYGLKVGISLNK